MPAKKKTEAAAQEEAVEAVEAPEDTFDPSKYAGVDPQFAVRPGSIARTPL